MITVCPASEKDLREWNNFVHNNYPPIGAFMQTREWGEFQAGLGRPVRQYLVKQSKQTLAVFNLVEHHLPLGFSYGYLPRGPVLKAGLSHQQILEIFIAIKKWAKKELSHLVFLRLEPPRSELPIDYARYDFYRPLYYVQPRFNLAIQLEAEPEAIAATFHPSTRSNLRRATRRGVSVQVVTDLGVELLDQFLAMSADTAARNGGQNIYPPRQYFTSFLQSIPAEPLSNLDPTKLSVVAFCGYEHNQLAAIHFVLFFGSTATYIYGACFRAHLPSKVTTTLHWEALSAARAAGFRYYDLGGIDFYKWPSLTEFKRQFRGEEFEYVGNIDLSLRPTIYHAYNLLRRLRHRT